MRPDQKSSGSLQTEVVEVVRAWRSNGDGGTVRDGIQDEEVSAAELAEFGVAVGVRKGYATDGDE